MPADKATLPPETRIGRVALAIADLNRMTDFYADVVGLVVRERTDDQAVLGTTETPFLVLEASDAPERAPDETGLFHTAFRVPDRTALGAALERIETDWRLTGASDHLVSEALYLRDPEDNGVEVYCDTPRETWEMLPNGRVDIDTRPLDLGPIRAAGDGGETVPAETDVGHIHLEVSSVAAAREFYVDTLGFRVRREWPDAEQPDALFVAAGDYHHHVGLNTWQGRTAPKTGRGLAWAEILVPEAGLTALKSRLRDADIEVGGDHELQITDPDGIDLRLRVQT
ncbi:VOC family protein [Halosegnis sp.]|uniref:VOC family protein n=1 Tax=Halosegnis sp. TaxID=2864959 RepID=UPI0035D4D52D